ncbi:MAG TPA: M48 family metallopeptidase [Blastocatellia bacterium]|nr:M48 family metallopeptidase [Blastocatellia bacterium]
MSSNSLAQRAALAVALMIGFYVLGIMVAGSLLFVPYAMWAYIGRVNVQIAFFCIVTAGVILLALIPRLDRFVAPGPKLEPKQHPRLFQEITKIAHAVQQEMPAEVYLVPEVNAWVAQRGGVMGFGSRRVMGLGLPLLQLLTTSQFRAVLAHEFGHYHGGDTKLGPWIYKTRMAIVRAVINVGERSSMVQKPFLWYGNMFMRLTQAVSRQQEFTADALAAKTIGAQPLADGLRLVHGAGGAFDAYWHNEVAPVLSAGYRTPLANGFAQFVAAPTIAELITKSLEEELNEAKSDPYDTHPPLRERLDAVAALPAYANGQQVANDPPAISLFENLPQLEADLFADLLEGQSAPASLQLVAWEETGDRVFMPMWKELYEEHRAALQGITPQALPEWAGKLAELGQKMRIAGKAWLTNDEAASLATSVLSCALAVTLQQRGAALRALPGAAVQMQSGETVIEPFSVVRRLAASELTAADWQRQCEAVGISNVGLG